MEHVEYKCKCDNLGCMFCDGGLFSCVNCSSFEGATTTHCPGVKYSEEMHNMVYKGTLDFRDGTWIGSPSGSCSSHYDGRPGLPQDKQ